MNFLSSGLLRADGNRDSQAQFFNKNRLVAAIFKTFRGV
jgi:hypothetical protein